MQFLRFGVRTGSTGFEPQELHDGSSPFVFRTLIYVFCALAGWRGTTWRASTDRSPAQRRCRLPGEYASSALASPSKRARREIARAAAGSKVVCT